MLELKGIDKYYESLMKLGNNKKEEILIKERYTEEEIKTNEERILKAFDKVYQDLEKEELPKEVWIKTKNAKRKLDKNIFKKGYRRI